MPLRNNYVSSDIRLAEQQEIEHPIERQSFRQDVLNPLLQNLFAGVGAAVITISIATIAQLDISVEWSLAIVGIVFGTLTLIRFASDEIRGFAFDIAAGRESARNDQQLQLVRQQYEQQADALRTRIRALEAVIAKHNLRAESPIQTEGKVSTEYAAAVKLLNRFFHNLDTSRAEVTRLGILNRPQWQMGINFLKDAGVLDQRNKLLVLDHNKALGMINQWAITKQRELR